MPARKIVLATGEVYHLLNKTIANEPVFNSGRTVDRIFKLVNYYRYYQSVRYSHYQDFSLNQKKDYLAKIKKVGVPLVEIFAFAFMTNHFHLLVRQISEGGISRFVSNVQNGFAKYYNLKYGRSGSLFQNMFKAIRIENDEQLIHVSRYIHLNPVTSFLMDIDELSESVLTSFPNYIGQAIKKPFGETISTDLVLDFFGSRQKYKEFVLDQVDYQRKLQEIKSLALD